MRRGIEVPINQEVLQWAIRDSGYRTIDVASHLNISEAELRDWLRGQSRPKLTQFRQLATYLGRQEATFLLPALPPTMTPQIEFRHLPGTGVRATNPRERRRVREAHRLQRCISWMVKELGEERSRVSRTRSTEDPDAYALTVRSILGITYEAQLSWRNESEALRAWRNALEDQGIIVLLIPIGSDSARGFSLFDPYAPLVAANTHWRPTARMFTLFHEYGHLSTRTDSICADVTSRSRLAGGDQIERWCEEFAASVLAPWDLIESLLQERFDWASGDQITDLNQASWLARKLNISLRAAVLRLIRGHVADWSLYAAIPPFVDSKSGGGGGGGRRRAQIRMDEYGKRSARAFVRALDGGLISTTDALTYLDVADTDLPAIESFARS